MKDYTINDTLFGKCLSLFTRSFEVICQTYLKILILGFMMDILRDAMMKDERFFHK